MPTFYIGKIAQKRPKSTEYFEKKSPVIIYFVFLNSWTDVSQLNPASRYFTYLSRGILKAKFACRFFGAEVVWLIAAKFS